MKSSAGKKMNRAGERLPKRARSGLRILLFGGFEVWNGNAQIRSFESQKVRALFAYLLCHRGRSLSREHLAELLWPERGIESGRRNLRQALYNLRQSLPSESADALILVESGEVRVKAEAAYWLDLEAFEQSIMLATGVAIEPPDLVRGVNLYRGELLAGLVVKDSLDFEEWLITERERYKDAAISALRTLMESNLVRGEYRLAIQFARRLLTMDPLSEESHRYLMRALALSGRRNRALAHYEELSDLLSRELGVEPLDETRELYETILQNDAEELADRSRNEVVGPILPLVGRERAFEELSEVWRRVLDGEGRVTSIQGEAGIGKTRLTRSFLNVATAQRRASVLLARCDPMQPVAPLEPVVSLLRHALADDTLPGAALLETIPAEELRELTRLLPEIAELMPAIGSPPRASKESRARMFAAARHLLASMCAPVKKYESGDPLILFIDDFQWVDDDSIDFFRHLAEDLQTLPIWLIVAERGGGESLASDTFKDLEVDEIFKNIVLGRLPSTAVEELASTLLDGRQVEQLTDFLVEGGAGLPIRIASWINWMWDERILLPKETREWRFVADDARLERAIPDATTNDLILRRVGRLPTSARRLFSLAAVLGQRFDAEWLREAERERWEVVELGLELLLERWMVRRQALYWAPVGRLNDLENWKEGARRGSFEFDHSEIRLALYEALNPLRRQVLHGDAGRALETVHGDDEELAETLAYHFVSAGEWKDALHWLQVSAKRALDRLCPEAARRSIEKAIQVCEQLTRHSDKQEERRNWELERKRLGDQLTSLTIS